MKGTGRNVRNAFDASETPKRKAKENFWKLQLRAGFPDSLNDRQILVNSKQQKEKF